MPSNFGAFVFEVLQTNGKNAAWLAEKCGLRPQTISAWMRKSGRQPKPVTVYRVAIAFEEFGVPHDRVAQAAGYPIRWSDTPDEQTDRLVSLAAAVPRVARNFTRIARLPPSEMDEVMSMIEAYLTTRSRRRTRRSKSK